MQFWESFGESFTSSTVSTLVRTYQAKVHVRSPPKSPSHPKTSHPVFSKCFLSQSWDMSTLVAPSDTNVSSLVFWAYENMKWKRCIIPHICDSNLQRQVSWGPGRITVCLVWLNPQVKAHLPEPGLDTARTHIRLNCEPGQVRLKRDDYGLLGQCCCKCHARSKVNIQKKSSIWKYFTRQKDLTLTKPKVDLSGLYAKSTVLRLYSC